MSGAHVIGVIPEYPAHTKNNIYKRVRMPPLGILAAMTPLSHRPGQQVTVIDENNYGGPREHQGSPDHRFLQEHTPADVAMFYGGMTNSVNRLYALAQEYQRRGVLTIAGGSHVDALPDEALASGIDIVVHGEADENLQAILDTGGNPEQLADIKGISFLDKGERVFTGYREPIADLDGLADPDLTLIKHLRKRWSAIPINRGRGCKYRCEFCVVNDQHGHYRTQSPEKTLEQVARYADMGYKDFFFTDDNFAQNPEEVIAFSRMLGDYQRRFNKRLRAMAQVRSEVAGNDELIAAMKDGGIDTLAIGYESPINEELRAMRKGVTVEQYIERSRKLAEHFHLHGMFIFGYPGRPGQPTFPLTERAKRYARFIKEARIDSIQVLNAIPLPGTKLRERLANEGRLLPQETVGWEHHDGLFLCYDPLPEGLDPFELHLLPKTLMKHRYQGGPIARKLNKWRWMNWVSNTAGFPVHFSVFSAKRFTRNLIEAKRERTVTGKHLFRESVTSAWTDFKRQWKRNLINTYAGAIAKRWERTPSTREFLQRLGKHFQT